jgi:hypothetical protein
METSCDCCDCRITTERDAYEYDELGILVCEDCYERLMNGPVDSTPEPEEDVEMEDLMSNMSIS